MAFHSDKTATFVTPVQPDQPPSGTAAWLREMARGSNSVNGGLVAEQQARIAGDQVLQDEIDALSISSGGGITQLTGDIAAGPGAGSQVATLPNVNVSVGTFQGITVNAKGQVTSAANQGYATIASVPGAANPTAVAGDVAINGSAGTFMRSDAAPAIQKASATLFGLAKVDGTTITAAGGVLSAATGGGGNVTGPATWTPGSVAFATSTTAIGQDNPNLFWDNANNRLGIGTTTPAQALEVHGHSNFYGNIWSINQSTGLTLLCYHEAGGTGAGGVAGTPIVHYDLTNVGSAIDKHAIEGQLFLRVPGGTTAPYLLPAGPPFMNANLIALNIYTPPDNGGDASAIYCAQTGGGNAVSFFNLNSERPSGFEPYPNYGAAIETATDGNKQNLTCRVIDAGHALWLQLDSAGHGLTSNSLAPNSTVFSAATYDATNSGKVITVANYGHVETFLLDFNGNASTTGYLRAYGVGQAVPGTVNTGTAAGATLFLQDYNQAQYNGGCLIFGTTQGHFAAIKGGLGDGFNLTTGDLFFSTRRVNTDATLTPAMTIQGVSGNLGIGHTSPVAKLHVVGAAGTPVVIATSDYVAGSTGSALLMGFAASTGNVFSALQAQSNGGTVNYTLCLQPSGGNVGIGTGTPGAKLDVAGNIIAYTPPTADNSTLVPTTAWVRLQGYATVAGGTSTYVAKAGDTMTGPLVISVPPSTGPLGLFIPTMASGDNLDFRMGRTNGTANEVLVSRYTYQTAGSTFAMAHWGDTADTLVLQKGGNVGVGTTAPAAKLHVTGASGVPFAITTNDYVASSTGSSVVMGFTGATGNVPGVIQTYTVGGTVGGNLALQGAGGNVGIGTALPGARLTVGSNTAALQAPPADTLVQIGNADNASNRLLLDTYGTNGNNLTLRRARGTAAAPSAVGNGDLFGTIAAIGYGVSAYSSARANVSFWAAQDWTASAQGAYVSFLTTPNGTTATAEAMRIDHNGNVGLGTAAPFTTLHSSRSVAGGLPATSGTADANVFARFQGATVAIDLGVVGSGDTWLQARSAGNLATNFPLLLNPNGGYVGIGTGTPGTAKLGVTGSPTAGALDVAVAGGPNSSDTTTKLVGFYDAGIVTLQGAITRNGASAVAYGIASDVRRKDNIGASETGLKAVMALKVRDFTFKGDDRKQQGLIAQELAEIYPIAVHEGGEDPLLEPWLVDYGRLTPLLIRAIQQQQIEINRLKGAR